MVTPKPVQKPQPPIWVAALSDEPMKRAGRLGDALLATPSSSRTGSSAGSNCTATTAGSRGRPHKVVMFREGFVAPTREQAIRDYEAGLLSTHRYYWRHGSYYQDVKREEDLDLKRISLDRLILGSPDDCIEKIRMWHREVGADYFLIRFRHAAGPPHEQVLEALELFGDEVIPKFRRGPRRPPPGRPAAGARPGGRTRTPPKEEADEGTTLYGLDRRGRARGARRRRPRPPPPRRL